MRQAILWTLLLCFPAPARAEKVLLPRSPQDGLAAVLGVEVLEPVSTPGLAEVRYTVAVEGGPWLEVEPASLGDATAAWRVTSTQFGWLDGDRMTLTEVLELRQVKPGLVALPSVKVQFRADARAAWEEAEWVDVLKPAFALKPEAVPELPGRAVPWWLWPAAATGMVVLIASLLGLLAATRPRKPAPPTAEQWALEELIRLEGQLNGQPSEWYHTRLSYIVRRFLEEKHGLRAARQTTAEFMQSVQVAPQLADEQRELLRQLLERCDLAKFALVQVSQDDCRQATELARMLVQGTGSSPRKDVLQR